MTEPDKPNAIEETTIAKLKTPVEQAILWFIEGERQADIVESITETYPDEDPERIIQLALDKFEEASMSDPLIVKGFVINAMTEVYRRMMQTGDYAGAQSVLSKILSISLGKQ